MTKAKARARAKARAAAKTAKPDTKDEKPVAKQRTELPGAKSNTMRAFVGAERTNSKAAMRRGAARSR
ncbi:MAG: hypothetical protein HKN60_02140 [Rhizobiales bacterium]|nr:hypothetical protein [Hyphomicrobiales bacterium]